MKRTWWSGEPLSSRGGVGAENGFFNRCQCVSCCQCGRPAVVFAAFQQNPYATYRHYQQSPGLHPLAVRPGTFLVFGYEDCAALFRDSRITSVRPAHTLIGTTGDIPVEFAPLVGHMQRWLLRLDPPKHTLLRKIMNPAFSPLNIERLRPQVEALVQRSLEQMQSSAAPDIIRDLAYPLPVQVIAEMLGLPVEFHERCIILTNVIATWFSAVVRTPENSRLAQAAVIELEAYFAELIRNSQLMPQNNLLGLLLEAARDEERLSASDLLAQCVMLLFAGHETTRHLIGNGMYSLLSNGAALREVRANLDGVPNALEEVLRFESPIQAVGRGVRADFDFAGTRVTAGSLMVFMVGAAQRDPRQYLDPDRLDVQRKHIRHFAFGGDAHACLGVALARLEAQVAAAALLRTFPHLALAENQADWGANFAIRGLTSLRVNVN